MEPIKLMLTEDGRLTGDVALPSESADLDTKSPVDARDLRPDEVVWSSGRDGLEARPLRGGSMFPGGLTRVGDGGFG
jgi:hypothetical protein